MDIWRHFFTKRVAKHWNRFPREVVSVPCLSVCKRHLALIMCFNFCPAVVRQLGKMISVSPFQTQSSLVHSISDKIIVTIK